MKSTYNITSLQSFKAELVRMADNTRNDYMGYNTSCEIILRVCMAAAELGGFAAGIAETVKRSVGKYMKAAYISEKQAYCIARALTEAGVKEITYCA